MRLMLQNLGGNFPRDLGDLWVGRRAFWAWLHDSTLGPPDDRRVITWAGASAPSAHPGGLLRVGSRLPGKPGCGAGRSALDATPGGPLGLGRPPSGPGPHLNPFPTQARVGSPSEVGVLPQQALPSWPALHPRVSGSMPGLALNPRDEGVRAPWPSLMHACRIHR